MNELLALASVAVGMLVSIAWNTASAARSTRRIADALEQRNRDNSKGTH